MARQIDVTGMFNQFEMLPSSGDNVDWSASNIDNNFEDLDEVLEGLGRKGDYSMLPLAIKFMRDLTPYDLRSFYEGFSEIEESIFKDKGLDYAPIYSAYSKNQSRLESKYIDFAINYFNESIDNMMKYLNTIEYTDEQYRFITNRFNVVKTLLVEVGKHLSSAFYKDIIVNDGSAN